MILAAILLLSMILSWHFRREIEARSDLLGLVKALIGMAVILTLLLRLKVALLITLPLLPLLYCEQQARTAALRGAGSRTCFRV
jgi:hypothetical protein